MKLSLAHFANLASYIYHLNCFNSQIVLSVMAYVNTSEYGTLNSQKLAKNSFTVNKLGLLTVNYMYTLRTIINDSLPIISICKYV